MSINSAMLSGVSGLIANSSALAALSDNIANVNTVGYKRSTANFSTLVTAQSKNATYSAGGRHFHAPRTLDELVALRAIWFCRLSVGFGRSG